MDIPPPAYDLPGLARKSYLVTGGAGYMGYRLIRQLLEKGANKVVCFDVVKSPIDHPQFHSIVGSVLDTDKVNAALEGIDLVFHIASFGMGGKEMMNGTLVEEINVGGTKNLIACCLANGVANFIYTSSTNAVFTGQKDLPAMDETTPYPDQSEFVDHYSRTKSLAEQYTIKCNGTPLENANPSSLATCAVRPCAIYGEGEERHYKRFIDTMRAGVFKFVFGAESCRVDWIHVDNLIFGHLLAADRLLNPATREQVAGQVYCLSDEEPINNFEVFRPVVEAYGYTMPTLRIPFSVMYHLGHLSEILHHIMKPVWAFQPFLSRAEVCKCAVHHYCKTDKARHDLGYRPLISWSEGRKRLFDHHHHIAQSLPPPPSWGLYYLLALIVLVVSVCYLLV